MYEVSKFDAIDDLSSFLGTIVDSLRGLSVRAKVTKAFTEYVVAVKVLFNRHMQFERTKGLIQHLESCTCSFEKKSKIAPGRYQISAMLNQKWQR